MADVHNATAPYSRAFKFTTGDRGKKVLNSNYRLQKLGHFKNWLTEKFQGLTNIFPLGQIPVLLIFFIAVSGGY